VIIETCIAQAPVERREHRGHWYWGVSAAEPKPDTPPHSRDALWASIGNPHSFHLSRMSLCNALADAGFSSVLECHLPPLVEQPPWRATFAAFAGDRQAILSVPALNDEPWQRLPEPPLPVDAAIGRWSPVRWITQRLPDPLRGLWRRFHRSLTRVE
jgi:hypothetical protein